MPGPGSARCVGRRARQSGADLQNEALRCRACAQIQAPTPSAPSRERCARRRAFGTPRRGEVQGPPQARRHACKRAVRGQAARGVPEAAPPAQHPRMCPAARRARRPMRPPRPARCRRARPTRRRCRPRCPSCPRGGTRRCRKSAALTHRPAPLPPAGAPRAPRRRAPRAGAPRRGGPVCPPTAGALPGRRWPCPGAHPPRRAAAAARSPPHRTRRSRAARHGRKTGRWVPAGACRPRERRPCARGERAQRC
jgi:hypothetical protein